MNSHPGVAAELARRRAGYADPQAYAAPAAPAPAPAPGQYEQTQYGGGWDAATSQPAQPVAGQEYADPYGGQAVPVATDPAPEQYAAPAEAQYAPPAEAQYAAPAEAQYAPPAEAPYAAPAEAPYAAPAAEPATAGWTVTDPSPEVVAPDQVQAPEPTSNVSPEHLATFTALVGRSQERAASGDRVREVDGALADAVVAGAESQGFQEADRTAGDANHDLRFDGGPGESLGISLGRITGDDLAGLRSGHVPLTIRFQSATYSGELDSGVGDHGEVVVVSDEWSGQATSTVSLLLSLQDYVEEDLSIDAVAVVRDVGAAVAVVRGRLA
jgi:hypothetical protein